MSKNNFLQEGDLFFLKSGSKVYVKEYPRHYLYENRKFDFSLTNGELCLDDELSGEFIVIKTEMTGGGSDGRGGSFPDGHKVHAQKVYLNEITPFAVYFYQSGCFTCTLTNIKTTGRARAKWEIERNE